VLPSLTRLLQAQNYENISLAFIFPYDILQPIRVLCSRPDHIAAFLLLHGQYALPPQQWPWFEGKILRAFVNAYRHCSYNPKTRNKFFYPWSALLPGSI
jgi:hypothetical protein